MKRKLLPWGRLRRAAALTAAGLLLTTTAACGNAGGESAGGGGGGGEGPYKVGVLLGLTGSYAALGVPEREAIELYFDEVNANGGINGHEVELVILDSASDEGTAVNQLRKLATQEQVHAVLGPSSSGESIALQDFATSLKVPVISLASSNDIIQPAEEATYIFKQYTDTASSLQAQLEFAKERGWNRVGLLSTNDGYGQDAADNIDALVDEAGLELVGQEVFNASDTDVTAQLNKLGDKNPDVVLVWAVNPANAVVAKNAASIGFEPALFHSPGAGSAAYIELADQAAEGTMLQGSKVLAADALKPEDPQYEVIQNFVTKYEEAYGDTPGQYAANGWDGSLLLENAIKAAQPDPTDVQGARDAIRDALENETDSVVGVNAIYTFSPEYHGSKGLAGLAVLGVEDGQFVVEHTYE